MRFFSGFSLRGEEVLFEGYLQNSAYAVAGFSRGAIEAFEYVLQTNKRIDTLQLISPAFFMDKSDAFKRTQLHYYRKDADAYIETFLANVASPATRDLAPFLAPEPPEALEGLLYYRWSREKLQVVVDRGVEIELYLGGRDRIIEPDEAERFFKPYATVYIIKQGGHILDG
jgi:pimeloyl-ACP methyl ester carboxylesterase